MESWEEFLPAGCALCACLAGPKFGLHFLVCLLFVCVSALITSAIITSHILLLLHHVPRLYFGRLGGCLSTGVATLAQL